MADVMKKASSDS